MAFFADRCKTFLRSMAMGNRALYTFSFLFGLLIWEVIASFISPVVFAAPHVVAVRLYEITADGMLLPAFANSLQHFFIGFLLAFAVAIPFGFAMGRLPILFHMFDPIINAIFSIPSVCFVAFIMIWFGLFLEARIALVFFMSVFDMIVIIAAGARDIDTKLIDVARSFEATAAFRFRRVLLPASLPFVLTATRVGVVRAVNAMITAELFFATVNLGGLIRNGVADYDAGMMLGVIFLVGLFGLLLQEAVRLAEAKMMPWRGGGSS